jgi:hypothetical protein
MSYQPNMASASPMGKSREALARWQFSSVTVPGGGNHERNVQEKKWVVVVCHE